EPSADRRGDAGVLRMVVERVRLPGEPVEYRERLGCSRVQPQRGIRHPAGAARLEDGQRWPGLGKQRRYPDPLGLGLHQDAVRLALRGVVARAGGRLVLKVRADTSDGLPVLPAGHWAALYAVLSIIILGFFHKGQGPSSKSVQLFY